MEQPGRDDEDDRWLPASIGSVESAAASFLARYARTTREVYIIRLRHWFSWCAQHGLDPINDIRRPHVELFGRWLEEERKNSPVTVQGALTTVRMFYRLLVIDGVLTVSPAEHIRLPKVSRDDVKQVGLGRDELRAFIAAAREISVSHEALAVLLGVLGLRVSEACAVRIGEYGEYESGYRVLRLVGKGGRPATIPLPVPVVRILDACAGERTGSLLVRADGTQLNRKGATRWVKRIAKKADIRKTVSPHTLRHAMITNALDAGVPLRDVQIAARHSDPRDTIRYDRNRGNLERHAVHTVVKYIDRGR